ncbi:hypothetical protein KVG29_01410 [Caldicoprobacter algeriensis]|uniref:hypothetical protein n=1 Tax=Caldicoprobacter algeriensis TaxID=699281 RepID=UPI00207A816C|nr:hypothetical protein [Caldicoprobacter algeriensis]MCM8899881.1 hypothetical protein [Caldicoprobacter algeriensis]
MRAGGMVQNGDIKKDENDVLLELVHRALILWKKAEDSHLDHEKVRWLKSIYVYLLKEARRKSVTLNGRQLLERILYPRI